jgi:hypothetical protein
VRANLRDRDGRPIPRCVLRMRAGARRGAKPVPTALVVLSPFNAMVIEESTQLHGATEAMQRLTPISYEVDVKVGTARWRAEGKLTARTQQAITPREPVSDEEARRQALIEAALARRNAEVARSALHPKAKPPAKKAAPVKAKKAAPVKAKKKGKKR